MQCPYCEKERLKVNCAGSIDDDFSYCCVVCNLEYINWLDGGEKHEPYINPVLQKAVNEAFQFDKTNNDSHWHIGLMPITERCQIFYQKTKDKG